MNWINIEGQLINLDHVCRINKNYEFNLYGDEDENGDPVVRTPTIEISFGNNSRKGQLSLDFKKEEDRDAVFKTLEDAILASRKLDYKVSAQDRVYLP